MRLISKCKWSVLVGVATILAVVSPTQGAIRKHPVATHRPAAAAAQSLGMGSLTLHPCSYDASAYCGSLPRALDPTGAVSGTIHIHFEVDVHTDNSQLPLEPLVFEEGGPGYGSTQSRGGYLALSGPLQARHDVILMDQRGTGYSQAIDCPALQNEFNITLPAITQCAAQLGDTTDLYGTGLAADDLEAILTALGVGPVDLYGDSYGTYFSQTFSARHPLRLRALILDGAYPVKGLNPWYPEIGATLRHAFNAACERAPDCASLPGSAVDRLAALVQRLRVSPIRGQAPDGDGVLRSVSLDPVSLDYLSVSDALYYPLTRETDPAVRALTDSGDALPLLRLVAENEVASFTGSPGATPQALSNGLYEAVSCQDYSQIYNMTSTPGERLAERDAAFAQMERTNPGIYYPFTLHEYGAAPLDISLLNMCLTWPVPSAAYPPGQPIPPGAKFTEAPVLVLNGDMDTLTPALQGREVLKEYHHAQQVLVNNTFHVSAIGDEDNCAQQLVRNFITTLTPGDTSCAANIAEVRLVPKFARSYAELDPAATLPGNQGSPTDLRVAAAAAYALGDVLDLWWINSTGNGVGLRGGTWSAVSNPSGSATLFQMSQVRWTEDVAASGQFVWNYYKPGLVSGTITVIGPNGESGELTITFKSRERNAQATITGTIGGRKIAATMYAP